MTKTINEIIEGLDWVDGLIGTLCKEGRCPAMSVPARPDCDEDLLATVKIKAAIDHLKTMQWLPIADIPEEWRDGRVVQCWVRYFDESGGIRLPTCNFRSGEFTTPDYGFDEMDVYVTHVSLPPAPPALGKPEE